MAAKTQRVTEQGDLCQAVLNEIRQRPELAEAQINVAVDHEVITLTGAVPSDTDRMAVEEVAKHVHGVNAIADDLEVKPLRAHNATEVARDALKALRSHIFLSGENIHVTVRDGGVQLEGEVHSELQRMLAEAEVKRLRGVSGILNQIEVKPEAFAGKPVMDFEPSSAPDGSALFDYTDWIETGEAEAG